MQKNKIICKTRRKNVREIVVLLRIGFNHVKIQLKDFILQNISLNIDKSH